jgi:hypothetical protein
MPRRRLRTHGIATTGPTLWSSRVRSACTACTRTHTHAHAHAHRARARARARARTQARMHVRTCGRAHTKGAGRTVGPNRADSHAPNWACQGCQASRGGWPASDVRVVMQSCCGAAPASDFLGMTERPTRAPPSLLPYCRDVRTLGTWRTCWIRGVPYIGRGERRGVLL